MSVEDEFMDSWVNDNNISLPDITNIPIIKKDDIIKNDIIKDDILVRATKLLNEFKNKGVNIQGITEQDIIETWEDIFLLKDINPNKEYLNNLLKGIADCGFFAPRTIQCITVGVINRGNDIVAQAVAGNGKTAAFLIGSLLRVDLHLNKPQVLILSPTHELTDQIYDVVMCISKYTGLVIHKYRGGVKFIRDKTPHVIIGCPGRMEDLINRNQVNLNYLKTLILDEGDELLKRGFKEQVKKIIESIVETVQICLFSATYSKGILELCEKFMRDPAFVILPENQVISSLVSQWYIRTLDLDNKTRTLINIINENKKDVIVIFFNYCSKLISMSDELKKIDIDHINISARLTHEERTNNLNEFMNKKKKILLASDVVSRGIDSPNITLVINYDVPNSIESYIHRIGRAGRGDTLGNSITFINNDEDYKRLKYMIQLHSVLIKPLKNINLQLNE